MYTFHRDGTLPAKDEVFVFGSNLAGIHGAGAARVAVESFGAVYGAGMGLMGKCYAIPTKSMYIQTLSIHEIAFYVRQFREFATFHRETPFFVTRVGCGLAGYMDSQIAPLFYESPPNCSFAESWRLYLS